MTRPYRILLVGLAAFLMSVSCNNQQDVQDDAPQVVSSEESPAATTPATTPSKPKKDSVYYAVGPRRQNWDQMFHLKGNVAKVIITEKIACYEDDYFNRGEYKFNSRGDVISCKWNYAPQDSYERVVGGHCTEDYYKYDSKGRLIEKVEITDPHMGWGTYTETTYKYNARGHLIRTAEYTRHHDCLFWGITSIYCDENSYDPKDEHLGNVFNCTPGNVPAHEDIPVPIESNIKNGAEKIAGLVNAGHRNEVLTEIIYDDEGEVSGKVTIEFDSRGNVVKFITTDDYVSEDDCVSDRYEFTITYR